MARRKSKTPSNNFCVICGRYTNKKSYAGDNWSNQFFVCNKCQKVWCGACMGQITGTGPSKTYKLGRKGQVNCSDCGSFVAMIKNPENLQFVQIKGQVQGQTGEKTCTLCDQKIRKDAKYCDFCGNAIR